MTALELRDVSKVYGDGAAEVHALRGVSLTVEPGALVAIMGPSGSGKSTMLTIAGSLEDATSGEVLVGGRAFVGIVENPANLQDQFALLAPGQVGHADRTTVLFDATVQQVRAFRLPAASQLASRPPYNPGFPPAAVLVFDTIALVFVGLNAPPVALAAGWLLAGREPHAIDRQPLD